MNPSLRVALSTAAALEIPASEIVQRVERLGKHWRKPEPLQKPRPLGPASRPPSIDGRCSGFVALLRNRLPVHSRQAVKRDGLPRTGPVPLLFGPMRTITQEGPLQRIGWRREERVAEIPIVMGAK
jgi:hypothetical protein